MTVKDNTFKIEGTDSMNRDKQEFNFIRGSSVIFSFSCVGEQNLGLVSFKLLPSQREFGINNPILKILHTSEKEDKDFVYTFKLGIDDPKLFPTGSNTLIISEKNESKIIEKERLTFFVSESPVSSGFDKQTTLSVQLHPSVPPETKDVKLWKLIKEGAEEMSFENYFNFMEKIFCGKGLTVKGSVEENKLSDLIENRKLPFSDTDSYRAVKIATEAFVMVRLQVNGDTSNLSNYLTRMQTGDLKLIPYLAIMKRKIGEVGIKSTSLEEALLYYSKIESSIAKNEDSCYGIIMEKLTHPCFLELIWNYWHEESMMVQGINAICRRFQNIRNGNSTDPLASMEIGPLRYMNNLLWGYIQDEQHRLTVRRRAYEYDHHYGITLQGNAVKGMRMADSRSKFIEAFHILLNQCVKFYRQSDNTTIVPDGFPVLNALKEVHLIISEGMHNQYGDLPSTARIEMLMQQYLLARPELRQFLPTREMVPLEPWMGSVSVLNQLFGWTKTNVIHYRDLGVSGEKIILSIRFGDWSNVTDRGQAANWANFWRSEIQNYIHAYRTVTGVDLTREDVPVDRQQPSIHLLRRLQEQNGKARV